MLIKWLYSSPQLCQLWRAERLSYSEHVVQSLLNTSFWYPCLQPHLTTYNSNTCILIREYILYTGIIWRIYLRYMLDSRHMENISLKLSLCGFVKVAAPNTALRVLDNAMQVHGGGGLSSDFPLAHLWATARTLRIADGPDEVHLDTIAKLELQRVSKL